MSQSIDLANRVVIVSSQKGKILTPDQIQEVMFLASVAFEFKFGRLIVPESFVTGANGKPALRSLEQPLSNRRGDSLLEEPFVEGKAPRIESISGEAYSTVKFVVEHYIKFI